MVKKKQIAPRGQRLDALVVSREFASTLEDAERLIRAGEILVNDQRVDKPGTKVQKSAVIRCTSRKMSYVSRGGLKMEAALQGFDLDVRGLRCLDVGIGTGGFTDCLLQHGAVHVTGVDVGYGDVAWKLRQDPRVELFERTNFRIMDVSTLSAPFDLVVVDCSFISLEALLPNLATTVTGGGRLLALVKPQFEADKSRVDRGGRVSDESARTEVAHRITEAATQRGFVLRQQMDCPVHGARAGNVELLLLFTYEAAVS